MEFHPNKCQVLRVTKKTSPATDIPYSLHGHTLEVVDDTKYLGVTISGDLNWDKHINTILNKANSTLAVLKRNIKIPSKNVKSVAYKTLVRPLLEYCSSVWDPPTKQLKSKLEMVQRRSARWVHNSYYHGPNSTSPSDMIVDLEWPLLETRRQHARLCLLYKMRHDLVHMSSRSFLSQYTPILLDLCPHTLFFLWTFSPLKTTTAVLSFLKLSKSGIASPLSQPQQPPLRNSNLC